MVHYQVFTIESNRQNVEMAFSVDRKHIIEHPTKRRPFPEIHIPAAERIDPPPFGSITILVSIRDNRVIRVVANGKELPELSMSGPNDIVASTRGPLTLDANGAFGCYVGASSEGMSGEFLKAELFLK